MAGVMALMLAAAAVATPPASPGVDPPFAMAVHPPAPDYGDAANWAVWRGGKAKAPVDLFFISPTTFLSQHWNADVGDAAVNRWTKLSVLDRQITAFARCCRLYAPLYRQASIRAFAAMEGDGAKAYALAYEDVRRAFRWYLDHENHGRPFLIVGHSQGALHTLRLLREEIDGTPIARRLVVAYAPGIGVSVGSFGKDFLGIAPCLRPAQTGCLASWNSFEAGADATAYVARSSREYVAQHGADGSALFCINPLTFDDRKPAAEADANRGSLLAPPQEGVTPPLVPHAAGAECRDGVLRITSHVALTPLPGGSLHAYDVPLFWANLRLDAERRVAAFQAHRP